MVKESVKSGAASSGLRLEQLPGYAPELNPEEGFWKHLLKYVELKNVCCWSLCEVRWELRKAKEHLGHKQSVILGCIRHSGGFAHKLKETTRYGGLFSI